jgi:hypothetical protein
MTGPGATRPPQARVADVANPHFSDWWDRISSDITAALERAAKNLTDPFAESMASVGCDIAHEAFCAGWEAARTMTGPAATSPPNQPHLWEPDHPYFKLDSDSN